MRFNLSLLGCVAATAFMIGCGGGGSNISIKNIFIVDASNNRIANFTGITGANWQTFGTAGNGAGQFNIPLGIARDSTGRIYIADFLNHRIIRIDDMSGAGWVSFGSNGNGVNQFNQPNSVFVDSSNNIYVSDTGNDRIASFTSMTGTGWTTFGSNGAGVNQFDEPTDLRLHQRSACPNNEYEWSWMDDIWN